MIKMIADILGVAANVPFLKPLTAFVVSVIASLLTWYISGDPWATSTLGVGILFAVWGMIEGWYGSAVVSAVIGLYGFWVVSAWDNSLRILSPTPHGCIMLHGRTADECIAQAVRDASSE